MTGFSGLVLTSTTGARSMLTPMASSSLADASATRRARRGSPVAPTAMLPGKMVAPVGDAHDQPAFLVDRDEQRHRVGDRLQVGVQARQLRPVVDVARKERHAAQVQALDEGAIAGIQRRALEAEHEHLADALLERHARQRFCAIAAERVSRPVVEWIDPCTVFAIF